MKSIAPHLLFVSFILAASASAQTNTFPSSGNAGIGTTTPYWPLVVTADYPVVGIMRSTSASQNSGLVLGTGNGNVDYELYVPPNTSDLRFYSGGDRVTFTSAGNVGIGTSAPAAPLDVGVTATGNGVLRTVLGRLGEGNTTGSGTFLGVRAWATQPVNAKMFSIEDTFYGYLNSSIEFYRGSGAVGGFMTFATGDGTERLRINPTGNVGIGTTNPTQKLSVNGTIRAKEVIVDTGWSDYVFEDSYRLAPLSEVESHIKANKHLPGIPSAAEVAEHGVSMGDMQSKLLAKIEELTLYMIELKKENAGLRSEMSAVKQVISNHNQHP